MNSNTLKCQLVMLPEIQKATQQKVIWSNNLNTLKYENMDTEWDDLHEYKYKPNHFYIISDREIKEGDWVYNPIHKVAYQWIKNADIKFDHINAKKIEATTNPKLGYWKEVMKKDSLNDEDTFFQIPESFIKAYIESYNNGKVIEEVLIETCDNGNEEWQGDNENGEPYWNPLIEVKIRLNNTVIIHQLKQSYTRDEVIELCNKAYGTGIVYKLRNIAKLDYEDYTFKNWIKANL